MRYILLALGDREGAQRAASDLRRAADGCHRNTHRSMEWPAAAL